jgi:RNA polymerase sigma factor (sigma-70 family)
MSSMNATLNPDGLLWELIDREAEPVIRQIFRSRLRGRCGTSDQAEAEDLRHDVLVRLLVRMRESVPDPAREVIQSFKGYVAATASNVCYEYLRQKYPRRWMLKRRIRRILESEKRFALWKADRRAWFCGLHEWQGQTSATPHGESLSFRTEGAGKDARRIPVLLDRLFRLTGGPMELDRVVELIGAAIGVQDQVPVSQTGGDSADAAAFVADPRADFASRFERKRRLARLWQEILRLPLPQRTALLLNLRDGDAGGVIEVLPLAGIATKAEIALAVGMPVRMLEEIWDNLPLPDTRIAQLLGMERQQIINLRKAARARLGRRMPDK